MPQELKTLDLRNGTLYLDGYPVPGLLRYNIRRDQKEMGSKVAELTMTLVVLMNREEKKVFYADNQIIDEEELN